MALILAQGAEHTNPDRLRKIVNSIKMQANEYINPVDYAEASRIRNMYEKDFPVDWPVYSGVQYVAEEKFDGYSYLNNEGRFFSKRLSEAKGSEGQPVEKTGHMIHLAAILKTVYEKVGCDLHGEVFVPGGISDDVTRILGCNEDEAIRRQWDDPNAPKLHYMLIDIRKYKGQLLINEPYYVRRALLDYTFNRYIGPYNQNGFIHIAPILPPDPEGEFRRIVLSGGEGIIMKRTTALYVPGKKPANNWVKGKKKITLDVVITGYNDGTGKNKSLFGSIEFGLYVDGTLKKMGNTSSGLDDNTRQMIAADPDKYIGTVVEIEAIQESRNSFRNAVFLRLRDDKSGSECTPLGVHVKENLLEGV
jgi:ATP-dependent DNA ligase